MPEEMMSFLGGEETRWILDAPGVMRSDQGPLASPELFTIINLPKRDTGTDANVPLRGVTPAAFEVHEPVRMIAATSGSTALTYAMLSLPCGGPDRGDWRRFAQAQRIGLLSGPDARIQRGDQRQRPLPAAFVAAALGCGR